MRVIVLVTGGNYASSIVLNNLFKNNNIQIIGIVESSAKMHNKGMIQSFFQVLEYSGVFYLTSKIAEYASYKIGMAVTKVLKPRKKRKLLSNKELAKYHNSLFLRTRNINDSKSVKFLKDAKPDLILSVNFNQILDETVINIPPFGCINLHPGPLPKYRGLNPYFWVVFNGDKYGGSTVHYIDKGIDTGRIIAMKKIRIRHDDTPFSLLIRSAEYGHTLIASAIEKIKRGVRGIENDNRKAKYYSIPRKEDVLSLRKAGIKIFSMRTVLSVF